MLNPPKSELVHLEQATVAGAVAKADNGVSDESWHYSFNMLGDAMRDLLDPRLRGSGGRLGVGDAT